MERDKAIALFTQLHALALKTEGDPESDYIVDRQDYEEPSFDVRLDAGSQDRSDDYRTERTWRVRVSQTKAGYGSPDELIKVVEVAQQAEVSVIVQNNGLELY
jgi:hypothetical protein